MRTASWLGDWRLWVALHSVAFTLLLSQHDPAFAWPLVAFTLLVALSRVMLGVHYPSDVVAGGLLGGLLGAFFSHL